MRTIKDDQDTSRSEVLAELHNEIFKAKYDESLRHLKEFRVKVLVLFIWAAFLFLLLLLVSFTPNFLTPNKFILFAKETCVFLTSIFLWLGFWNLVHTVKKPVYKFFPIGSWGFALQVDGAALIEHCEKNYSYKESGISFSSYVRCCRALSLAEASSLNVDTLLKKSNYFSKASLGLVAASTLMALFSMIVVFSRIV